MSSPIEMLVEGKLAIWQLRQVQTLNALTSGLGLIAVSISAGPGNFFIVDTLRVGPDDYTGGNFTEIQTVDEDSNESLEWVGANLDNVRSFVPSQNMTDADTLADSKQRYILIAGDDIFMIRVGSLELNETITYALRAFVSAKIPTITITVTGTGATVSTSTTLNKVVV